MKRGGGRTNGARGKGRAAAVEAVAAASVQGPGCYMETQGP